MSYFSITSCDKSAVESVTILIFAYYILPFPIRSPCYYTSIPIAFNNLERNLIKLIIFLYLNEKDRALDPVHTLYHAFFQEYLFYIHLNNHSTSNNFVNIHGKNTKILDVLF